MDIASRRPRFSIVIPVYNAAPTLVELHERLISVMESLGRPFEVVMVDDGSRDDSWRVICTLARSDPRVRGLQLMRNYGQANATMAGLEASRGDLLVTMDDDLQNPPEEIAKLVAAFDLDPNLDVLIGAPRKKQHAAWRNAASNALNSVSSYIFTSDRSFKLTSFRLMRREVAEPLFSLNIPTPAPGAQLHTVTGRIRNVEVDHDSRPEGRSGYTLTKMVNLTVSKLLGFTTFPLRFLTFLGITGVGTSMILGVVYLWRYLAGVIQVPGWTTLVLLQIFVAGFIFLAFGIVGEYLQQILLSVRRMPAYLIRSEVSFDGEARQSMLREPSSPDPGSRAGETQRR
jgi:dolichol-phosphate mannosyltransferase/undecaprenyl-phosphate 4-deoxy-4-formamido-L-arabinose transferase